MTASSVPAEREGAEAAPEAPAAVAGGPGAGERTAGEGARRGGLYRHRRLALGAIFVLALLLRAWALDLSPPSLDPDEVSIGYNAWSIWRTGRDEYGQPLPLSFRAFGEYKRPAYI